MARSSPTSPATRPLKAIGAAPTPMPAPCSPAGTSPVTPGMSLEHGLPPAVVLSMLSDNEANPAPRAPSIMGALAEFERSLIIERVTAGIPAAKKRGKHVGRPPKLSREQFATVAIRCGSERPKR
jgi:hypothetical protein